ncbi:hypothetical protein D3H55_10510 [Bacillus salacetis]|uniref:Uncharacterized protein n=1 Tax=Bacillus salacetis TaxID=2315464 RepID=A0A3A1QZ02_9BACI|nr:hypothetical protein [Bacillus salacetis]RIW34019.1 hypothetical protein D3H55_10510 [Bacillus salacetis]
MYLTEADRLSIVKKQFRFKLKSFKGMFTSLIVLQIIGIFLSLNGDGSGGGSSQFLDYRLNYYNGNIIFAFVMIWAFISAILITTKAYRFDDYSFVTDRMTSHLSNVLFLLAASFAAGITAVLANRVVILIIYFMQDNVNLTAQTPAFLSGITGIIAMTLYIFLLASVGYLAGNLVQVSKLFIVVLPAVTIGSVFLETLLTRNPSLVPDVFSFFGMEESFWLFVLKVLIVSGLSLSAAAGVSMKLEVK